VTNRQKAILGYNKGIVNPGLLEDVAAFSKSKTPEARAKLAKAFGKIRFLKRQIGLTKKAGPRN
jgi:hypothetical protein